MIFYNASRFIEEAIASVLAQSFRNWELLLVDDGSTDDSTDIAVRYATSYPERIRYLSHPGKVNLGMSASRNLGIANAQGDLIAFLDADDVYLPHKLEEQTALMARHPEVGMLFGRTLLWHGWVSRSEDVFRDQLTLGSPVVNQVIPPPQALINYLSREQYYPCMCSIVVRREAIDAVGGFEEEFRGTYEDMAFHSKIFLRFPVLVSDSCWDLYRQHPDSSWADAIRTRQYVPYGLSPVRRRFLEWLSHHLTREGKVDPDLDIALQGQMWPYRHPVLFRAARALRRSKKVIASLMNRGIPASGIDHSSQKNDFPDVERALFEVRKHCLVSSMHGQREQGMV
jgi:glycosyltransferase involved in cell wall biosynthesis